MLIKALSQTWTWRKTPRFYSMIPTAPYRAYPDNQNPVESFNLKTEVERGTA